jgi:arabinose-5-phosphate isomerase
MSSKGFGCVGIISTDNKKLLGIITDGDLRRNMTKGLLEKKVEQIMTVNPLTLKPETLVSEALNLMNEKSITNIFVTQKDKPVGIVHMHEILRLST